MPRSSAQQPGPAAPAATGRSRRGPVSALLLGLSALASAAAGPAPEYGPEAEARFLERCVTGDVTTPAASPCRRLMERLQAEFGYPRFLEAAAGGPEAFGHPAMGRVMAASPATDGTALR
jgi:hypothetical protein